MNEKRGENIIEGGGSKVTYSYHNTSPGYQIHGTKGSPNITAGLDGNLAHAASAHADT